MRTWCEYDFLVKFFVSRSGCFAFVVFCHLNADIHGLNPRSHENSMAGRFLECPTSLFRHLDYY